MRKILFSSMATLAVLSFATTVGAVSGFFNGFEVNTVDWEGFGVGTIERVISPTDGIVSADGDYHARVTVGPDFNGAFTRWGGYESIFPANGYVTEVDVYLDMTENTSIGTDRRFDYSSAINDPAGVHRRDFIFNVGTNPSATGQFILSASNNAPGWPANPGRSPVSISQSGWYTLRHTFRNNGGVLAVDMQILNSSGTVLQTWTLSDPTDLIDTTVGGNRYGWYVTSDFATLAIDNSSKTNIVNTPVTKDECKNGGWMNFFKNQGECVSSIVSNRP